MQAVERVGAGAADVQNRLSLPSTMNEKWNDPPGWNITIETMTPEKMRGYSEEFLTYVPSQNRGGVYDAWAHAEIARRQSVRLAELIMGLNQATETVKTEVRDLTDSSNKMEQLTRTLKILTIWLIVFAAIQVLIAVIQTKKMYEPIPAPQIELTPVNPVP